MKAIIPHERIESRIYIFRGVKVMVDFDLASLYGVQTKRLNEAVKRNVLRFPEDFAFQLSKEEHANLKSQIATSSSHGGSRRPPMVFTEHGVAMLSSVLKSEQAVTVNIQIIRSFIKLRDLAMSDDVLLRRIEILEKNYDERFKIVFDALRRMYADDDEKPEIGFER